MKAKRVEKKEQEYIEKLVSVNRVVKVVKGGKRFSFAALVIVGDGNGHVGHGHAKAKEVSEAVQKATAAAKKSMIRVPLREGRTIHHDVFGAYGAGKIQLRSAPTGTGVIAGGAARAVFEAVGVKDVVAKSVGSSNPHNIVRALFDAFHNSENPKKVSQRRGLAVSSVLKARV